MVVNCPNCGKENKNTNIKCEFCSTKLIDENKFNQHSNFLVNDKAGETKVINVSPKTVGCLGKILGLMFVGPWILVGIVFLGVGLFSSISERNHTKGFEQTTGILTNCVVDEAIYEYQVNGDTYIASPNMSSNCDGFKERDIVYYNPNNPSESIMYANWSILIIIGLILVIVPVIISIYTNNQKKKILKGEENITMKVYKT